MEEVLSRLYTHKSHCYAVYTHRPNQYGANPVKLKELLFGADSLVDDILADDLSLIETEIDLENFDPLSDEEIANICKREGVM